MNRPMNSKFLKLVTFPLAFTCICILLSSRTVVSQVIQGTTHQDAIDPEGLKFLETYRSSVAGEVGNDLRATGELTLGRDGTKKLHATLEIADTRGFRLSAEDPDGFTLVSNGTIGMSVSRSDNRTAYLSRDTAEVGITHFQLLRVADISKHFLSVSNVQRSSFQGNDALQIEVNYSVVGSTSKGKKHLIKFFFDAERKLIGSSTEIALQGSSNLLLLETSYSDYRRVQDSLIPFRIVQTLDGQPQWDFQANDAALGKDLVKIEVGARSNGSR